MRIQRGHPDHKFVKRTALRSDPTLAGARTDSPMPCGTHLRAQGLVAAAPSMFTVSRAVTHPIMKVCSRAISCTRAASVQQGARASWLFGTDGTGMAHGLASLMLGALKTYVGQARKQHTNESIKHSAFLVVCLPYRTEFVANIARAASR
ncbi:MAG: hypothetical protein H5T64_11865 [Chloroflexi bacterium]|nr:hypothetical protein [Chloroflexota bacterium]